MRVPCYCVKALPQALAICLLLPALSNSEILHSCFSLWWYQTRKCVNWSISKNTGSFWLAHSCKWSLYRAVTISFCFRTAGLSPGRWKYCQAVPGVPVTPWCLMAIPRQPPCCTSASPHLLCWCDSPGGSSPWQQGVIASVQHTWLAPNFL